MSKRFKRKILYRIIIVSFLIIYMLIFMNIVLGQDEDFTMSIIRHSYSKIIYLDSLDVHPPLYYLILKTFLQVSTFWTNSIFIKILFARIPSLIFSIITFITLTKIINMSGYQINIFTQIIGFMIIPSIMLYSTQIRMYSLVTMCITLEFYELLKSYRNNYIHIVIAVLFADLAAYSHYFGAVSAGILLLIFSYKYLRSKQIKYFCYSLLIDILFVIMYIPWSFVAFKQVVTATPKTTTNISGISKITELLKELIYSLIGAPTLPNRFLSILFLIPLFCFLFGIYYFIYKNLKYCNNYFKSVFNIIFVDFIFTILFGEIYSLITHPFYNHRYVYPVFVIMIYFVINLLFLDIKKRNLRKPINIVVILLSLFMIDISSASLSIANCMKSFDVVKMVKKSCKSKKNYISLNNSSNPHITHMSVYLYSSHKRLLVNHINSRNSFGRSDPKLFSKIYNNVKSNDIK